MENPIRMADLGGTIIFGNTHIKGCDLKTSTAEASDIEQTRKKNGDVNVNDVIHVADVEWCILVSLHFGFVSEWHV